MGKILLVNEEENTQKHYAPLIQVYIKNDNAQMCLKWQSMKGCNPNPALRQYICTNKQSESSLAFKL